MEIISVPLIVAIVYFALEIYKKTIAGEKENLIKIIPLIAGCLGMVLGVLAFYLSPDIMPAQNILSAILVGLASGLAATGSNQIIKQFLKNKDVENNTTDNEKDTKEITDIQNKDE